MEAILEPNPSGCENFEVHPFKPGLCKSCGSNWKLHKGIIDDGLAKQLWEKEQKADADKHAKEAAQSKGANTFENRLRRQKEQTKAERARDDWFHDGGGSKDSLAGGNESDSDGEGFTMQVITPSKDLGKSAGPVKAAVIRNLLDDFDEMNVASPVHRRESSPKAKSALGTSSNSMAPLPADKIPSFIPPNPGSFMTDSGISPDMIRIRKELSDARKAALDARNDLEDKDIELEMLKEDMKDLKSKFESHASSPKAGGEASHEELAQLKASLEEKDKEIERLKAGNSLPSLHTSGTSDNLNAEEEYARLRRMVASKEIEIEKLTSEAASNKELLESATKESSDARLRAAASSSELATLRAELEALKLREQLDDREAAGNNDGETEALKQTVEEKDRQLEDAVRALEELKLSSTKSRDLQDELRKEMDAKAEDLRAALEELEGVKSRNVELTRQVEQKTQAVEQLEAKNGELEATVSEAKQRSSVHVQKIESLEKESEQKLKKVSAVLLEKEAQLEQFNAELQAAKDKEAALEAEKEKTKDALAELDKLRLELEEKSKIIEEKTTLLASTENARQADLASLTAEVATLKADIDAKRKLLNEAKYSEEDLRAELASASSEAERLRGTVEEKERISEEKDKLLRASKAEVKDKEAAIGFERQKTSDAFSSELDLLRGEINEKAKLLDRKEASLVSQQDSAKADIASLVGEVERLEKVSEEKEKIIEEKEKIIEEKEKLLAAATAAAAAASAVSSAAVLSAADAAAKEQAGGATSSSSSAAPAAAASPPAAPTIDPEGKSSDVKSIGLAQIVDSIEKNTTLRDELMQVIHTRGYLVADGATAPEDNHEPNEENADALKRQLETLRQTSASIRLERDAAVLRASKAETKADMEVTQARRQGALVAAHAFREVRQNAETQFAWLFDKVHKAQAQTAAASSGGQPIIRQTTA